MTHVGENTTQTCDFYFFTFYYFSICAVAVEGSNWLLLLPVFLCWTETCTVVFVVLHANVKILIPPSPNSLLFVAALTERLC